MQQNRAAVGWASCRLRLDLFGRGFVLLRLGVDGGAAHAIATAAKAAGVPLDVITLQEPAVIAVYRTALVLVRPDGHVAWRGNAVADARGLVRRVVGA